MRLRVRLADRDGGGTQMTIETTFPSDEAMDLLLGMGFDQGLATAVGQIDGVLGAGAG
jgi:hypothetical protein